MIASGDTATQDPPYRAVISAAALAEYVARVTLTLSEVTSGPHAVIRIPRLVQ